MRRSIRRLGAVLLGALGAGVPAVAPAATPPLTLVHDVTVSLDTRLSLAGGPGPAREVLETLEGPAGRTLSLARVVEMPGEPVRVFLALTPEPDEARSVCRVSLLSQVRRAGRTTSVERVLRLEPDRVALLDLWSDPHGDARLVLALTASWVTKPRLVPVVPGTEPVQFRVQEFYREGGSSEPLDDRMLVGLVGTPIHTTIERIAARPLTAPADPSAGPAPPAPTTPPAGASAHASNKKKKEKKHDAPKPAAQPPPAAGPLVDMGEGALQLVIDPQAIDGGVLQVTARAVIGGPAPPGGSGEPLLREAVAAARSKPGEPFEVRVGLGADGRWLVFRITPYF